MAGDCHIPSNSQTKNKKLTTSSAFAFHLKNKYVSSHQNQGISLPQSEFEKFVEITKRLRKECPWDREQTHDSIKHSLIEEAYEVVESIDHSNVEELKKELGDILLHVVFHSNIAEENNEFTLEEVIRGISEKMVRRHPHIYGDVKVEGAAHVKQNWEKIKMSEGRESIIDGVPKHMPALLRAHRIQEKASKVGFDWKKAEDAWKKVDEEMAELHQAIGIQDTKKTNSEFGDLLFALVNYSRFIGVNPENALRSTIDKFITRFQYIEKRLKEQNKDIHNSTLEEMDALWDEAKIHGTME
ncbi:MAG: nucleoside triphosphate pyrophosphohydrolase [Bacteroidetes bacterium]|nr:MAG: nucleoside triphosphate pyrophosphohydrolase [Bacteroidota bacterium]